MFCWMRDKHVYFDVVLVLLISEDSALPVESGFLVCYVSKQLGAQSTRNLFCSDSIYSFVESITPLILSILSILRFLATSNLGAYR